MISRLISSARISKPHLKAVDHRWNRIGHPFSNDTKETVGKRLAYFGSDEFSVVVIKHILASEKNLNRENLVVLSTGKPENENGVGRKNDLVKFAEKEKIPVWIPISSNIKEERIKQWRLFQARLDQHCKEKGMFDLGLVCSYGNLIPSYLIDYFQGVRC